MMDMDMALTPKQERFVQEYLIDLNATQAAIRAGYSQKTASETGYENLRKPQISEKIQEAMKERSERTAITQDMVLKELAKIGFSDLRKALTSNGALIDTQDWDDGFAGAVASVEIVKRQSGEYDDDGKPIMDHVHKIKTWDKVSALDKLGKHLGLFPTHHTHSGPDGGPIETKELSDTEVARRVAFLLVQGIEEKENGDETNG